MKYYKELALRLFDNGYKPIPIRPRSKVPFMEKDESWQVDINREQVKAWTANGKGGGSIALTGIGALDFDVHDKGFNNKMLRFIRENICPDVSIRVGHAPKFLIPVSAKSAIDKKRKITRYDQAGVSLNPL